MKKTDMGNYILTTGSFINKEYKPEWIEFVPFTNNKVRYCEGTFSSDDGNDFAVYDGATNYLGRIDRAAKKITEYNGAEDDYKRTFMNAALAEICK